MNAFKTIISAATGVGAIGNTLAGAIQSMSASCKPTFSHPTGKGVRGKDKYGEGHFGASRSSDGKKRSHNGTDFIATPNQDIYAVINGSITKIGYPYAND